MYFVFALTAQMANLLNLTSCELYSPHHFLMKKAVLSKNQTLSICLYQKFYWSISTYAAFLFLISFNYSALDALLFIYHKNYVTVALTIIINPFQINSGLCTEIFFEKRIKSRNIDSPKFVVCTYIPHQEYTEKIFIRVWLQKLYGRKIRLLPAR